MASNSIRFEHRGKVIEWTAETPASEIERLLPEMMRDRGWLATPADRALAQRWLAGDQTARAEVMQQFVETLDAQETEKMAENTTTENPDIARVREMNRIAATPEGREARQRAATGQSLTPQQAALVARYRELETKNNEVARAEVARRQGGTFKISRPHTLPHELFDLERVADPKERLHGIRELRSRWRDDKASAYNDVNHGDHKSAVDAMRRLYEAEEALSQTPKDGE